MIERLKKYIVIDEEPNLGRKTKIWCVYNKQTMEICGYVKWYGGWRKYIFETMDKKRFYDSDLLRYLGQFCEIKTDEQYGR